MHKDTQLKSIQSTIIRGLKPYLFSDYSNTVQQVSTFSPKAVKKGFTRYLDFLKSHNDVEQILVLDILKKHVEEYQKNRQTNLEQWRKEIVF